MNQRTKCVSLRKGDYSGSTVRALDYNNEVNRIIRNHEAEGYGFLSCINEGEFLLLFFARPIVERTLYEPENE